MIFKTSDLTTSKNDVKFLEAGIHENVKLVSARTEKTLNGSNFIEVTFVKDGASLKYTEYEPTNNGSYTQEQIDNRQRNVGIRLMEILKCFYTAEQLAFEGDLNAIFIWATALLNNADKSKEVRLKVTYNDRGFATLPTYTKFTYIEPMTVTSNNSRIVKLGIDRFERPSVDTEESNQAAVDIFAPGAALSA